MTNTSNNKDQTKVATGPANGIGGNNDTKISK
jgi:hypothetical protein